MTTSAEITRLLLAHRAGDVDAFAELLPLVYAQLRSLARRQLARNPTLPTLNATALVHEAYFQLVDETRVPWKDRQHFFAVAARAMRRIIIDHIRRRRALKRGGDQRRLDWEPDSLPMTDQAETLLAVEQGLRELEAFNPRLTKVVECRLFAGLSERETANALHLSVRTVQRDWRRARAWLQVSLTEEE